MRLVLLLAVLMLSSCANDPWQRMFYDVGDQYACTQSNNKKLGETARDAACADPSNPARSSYDTYTKQREAAREQ